MLVKDKPTNLRWLVSEELALIIRGVLKVAHIIIILCAAQIVNDRRPQRT